MKAVIVRWVDSSADEDRWTRPENIDNDILDVISIGFIVKDIDRAVPNFHFIGHDEGDISLNGLATIKLWHGEDGNSYSLSYRVQKIIEAFHGGEKPSVLLCGHTHKYVKLFERNIHAISVGTLERQTSWMRGKRIAAHVGFCIIDLWVNKNGVAKISETFYTFYS